jgi:hypothetical protein
MSTPSDESLRGCKCFTCVNATFGEGQGDERRVRRRGQIFSQGDVLTDLTVVVRSRM